MDLQLNGASLVTTSATTTPAIGATETWTVTALSALFVALDGTTTYSLVDATSGATANQQSEIIRITACTGSGATSITVTRGADGTAVFAHAATSTFNVIGVASYFASISPSVAPITRQLTR